MIISELENILKDILSSKDTKQYFNKKGLPFTLLETNEYGGYNDVYILLLDKKGRKPKIVLELWDYHVLRDHPAVKEQKPEKLIVLKPEELKEYFPHEELKTIMKKSETFQKMLRTYGC